MAISFLSLDRGENPTGTLLLISFPMTCDGVGGFGVGDVVCIPAYILHGIVRN